MIDKVQKIREEVEKLFNHVKDSNFESDSGAFYYLKDLLSFIDSLQEESVSEDLNEAAIAYNKKVNFVCAGEIPNEHFMAGANWQKQKDKHLLDKEFSAGYTEGQLAEISQSTIDAIRKEYKQQMMKNAYKGYVSYIRDDSEAIVYLKDSCITMPSYFPKSKLKDGDNVRILVIKDE